jgi:molybdate transport system substrate-binding protein
MAVCRVSQKRDSICAGNKLHYEIWQRSQSLKRQPIRANLSVDIVDAPSSSYSDNNPGKIHAFRPGLWIVVMIISKSAQSEENMDSYDRGRTAFAPSSSPFVMLIIALLLVAGCRQQPADNVQEINVAAAANLTDAFAEMAKQFTAKSGIRVVYSFGSSADLTKQIENGGPFDVFASADAEHIDELSQKGLVAPDSQALYARGRLVVWTPPQSRVKISHIEDVTSADVKTVAIAKPDLAPYGRATVETLKSLGIWPQVEPKAVYGSNVSTAKQYAASGNADVAFIPLALVKKDEGQYIEIDERLHQPIDQALAIVKASGKQDMARRFVDFVLGDEGRAILQQYGYSIPSAK